jgi:hypothetical protein
VTGEFGLCSSTILALVLAAAVGVAAQVGGKPVTGGNPTPGTAQPEPPNLSDRITLSGCLQAVPRAASDAHDANTPSDARFVLSDAQRVDRVPPGSGGSALAKSVSSRTFRLEGVDSQFSPFVNTKVEISGEVKASSSAGTAPALLVEFVQKLSPRC